MIDSTGCLIIQPANGAASGVMASWGDRSSSAPWKYYSDKIKSIRVVGEVKAQTLAYAFCDCSNLISADLSNLDISAVTNMYEAFSGCYNLTSLDVSGWDTSNVACMAGLFEYCFDLASLDVSGWDTSNVTEMYRVFNDCRSLKSLNLSNWKTSNATSIAYMFAGCSALSSLDLSNWNTSSVTNMYSMFNNCSGLVSLNMSGWDTSKVTDMSSMFRNCSSLTSLHISGWETSCVKGMRWTFYGCSGLTSLDLSNWDTSGVMGTDDFSSMSEMFYGCTSLHTISLGSKFSFSGGGDNRMCSLPTPSGGGLTGKWSSSVDGKAYLPDDVPNNVAANYVAQFNIDESMFSVDTSNATYTGNAITGRVTSKNLKEGMDYEVSYLNNVNTGTARVVITGKGNYAGTLEYAFEIVAPKPDPTPQPTPEPTPTPDPGPNPVQKFPDVDYTQWYADGITFCVEKGLITGFASGPDAGKFGVGFTLTRAQLAAILWRNAEPEAAESYDSDADNSTGMPDVADRAWYTGAANWAVAAGVINGADKNGHREFLPDEPVTAEQLAAILANYADPAGAEKADTSVLDGFADSDAISDWARGSVAWAKSKDIINGYDTDGVRLLKPHEPISRERVATILMNAFDNGVLK